MGPPDHLPDSPGSSAEPQSAEAILRSLGQDLETLRYQVADYLSEDIGQLQARKQRLMADIEALEGDFQTLQTQHQQLQARHSEAITQQQLAQQQVWAKRLAVALATHLQGRLESALAGASPAHLAPTAEAIAPLSASRLAAFDATLQGTLASLQQDLTSYHSNLSQQIARMQSVEQQGEAILEALVARLSQQLQAQMLPPTAARHGQHGHGAMPPAGPMLPQPSVYRAAQTRVAPPAAALATPPASHRPAVGGGLPVPPRSPQGASGQPEADSPRPQSVQAGWLLVVLSTLLLALHNVVVGVIGYGGPIFGQGTLEALLPLTMPNALLLLWLRMVVVLPLLALVAPRLYPGVWSDLRHLFQNADRRPLVQVLASGGFLFLSQVLIYKAIADVGPGVAVTLLFMYPLLTVPLAWFLFGDRPTPLRLVVMFAITMGIVFTALPQIYGGFGNRDASLGGVGAALLASVAFALFLVTLQLCFRRTHPVSVSLLQLGTVFGLSSVLLLVGSFLGLETGGAGQPLSLYLGAGLLGGLTLVGYLFNNYGVQRLGAAQAAIMAATVPLVTAVLAYLITPGERSALLFIQWMGVILVTLGVIFLGWERLAGQQRRPRRNGVPANTGQWL